MVDKSLVHGMMGAAFGLKIIENPHITMSKQFRFPRCKSKRIAKKYKKQTKNFKMVPDTITVYRIGMNIICHPALAARLRSLQ